MNDILYTPKKTFSRLGFALIAFSIVGYIIVLGLSWLIDYVPALAPLFSNLSVQMFLQYAPIYGLGFLFFWLISKKLPVYKPQSSKFSFIQLFKVFCSLYTCAYSGNMLGNMLSSIFHNQANITDRIYNLFGQSTFMAIFIPVFAAPFVEELIFRKMLIDKTMQFGEKPAILFSALCFGLFHLNLTQVFYAFGIGLVFGYMYTKTGKIHYSMIMHAIVNAISAVQSRAIAPLIDIANSCKTYDELFSKIFDLKPIQVFSCIVALVLGFMLLAFAIIGLVFLIRASKQKKIQVSPAMEGFPETTFCQTILNPGAMLYVLFCIAGIVLSFIGML